MPALRVLERFCQYSDPSGYVCGRRSYRETNTCTFHCGLGDEKATRRFLAGLRRLCKSGETTWRGFKFPPLRLDGLPKLPDSLDIIEADFNNLHLNAMGFRSAIVVTNSSFKGSVVATDCNFEAITLAECNSSSPFLMKGGQARELFGLSHCRFTDTVTIGINTTGRCSTTIEYSEFADRVFFHGAFSGPANIQSCIFESAVSFIGNLRHFTPLIEDAISFNGRPAAIEEVTTHPDGTQTFAPSPTASKRQRLKWWLQRQLPRLRTSTPPQQNRVFNGGGYLRDLEFRQPTKVLFQSVSLGAVSLMGTDLRGASFIDVDFSNETLGRSGLVDELAVRSDKNPVARATRERQLADQYRLVRLALEERKNYQLAADFYYGELEAKRRARPYLYRHFFSMEAIYHAATRYGTSVSAGICTALLLVALHAVATLLISDLDQRIQLFAAGLFPAVVNSLQVLTLQRDLLLPPANVSRVALDVLFRLLGAGQLAMLVLAIRGRIRRY
jgi:uncharacterized protein YjbI with pentapeptide repeats